MNSGKLLKISDERSIFIIQNEDESYITKENVISYRNIGESFETKMINECYTNIDAKGNIHVLDAIGNSKFYFPAIWLDTNTMKLIELQNDGIIQLQK
jgi:hypothetical protein